MDIVSTNWKSKHKISVILYIKLVQYIFVCYRVAHVNRIFPKHTVPYIINMIDEPKI